MFNKIKSPETLFNKTLTLTILNGNILYLTHTVDKCLAILNEMQSDKGLQKQVNEYFEKDTEDTPEVD